MARPSNTQERRTQIVAALHRVMLQKGYEGATIVAIAKEAGLRSGLVHYHFKSKQAILLALVEQLQHTAQRRLDARLAQAGSCHRSRLDAWIDAQLATGPDASSETLAAWLFVAAEAARQPEVDELYRRAQAQRLQALRQLVHNVLRDEGRQTDASEALSVLLLATVEGCFRMQPDSAWTLEPGYAAPLVRDAARRWLDTCPLADNSQAIRQS